MSARTLSQLLEAIASTTNALLFALDADGKVVFCNRACERITGYSPEELHGRHWSELPTTPPDRINEINKRVFEELRQRNTPNRYAGWLLTKSGGRRFVEWTNSVVADSSGNIAYTIGAGIDVTDKHEIEQQLRDSRSQFEEVANALPVVFWIMSPHDNQVSYLSPGFEMVWGRSLPALNSAFEVFRTSIHPEDREAMFRKLELEHEGVASGDSDYRIIRPDGTIRWIHSHTVPVRDERGELCRIVGCAEDITERKRVEQNLSESQQRLKALLDSISDAAWLVDANLRYIEVNRAYTERWEFARSEIIGKTLSECGPAYATLREAEDREVLRTGRAMRVERTRMIHGEERWLETVKTPVFTGDGKVIGIAGLSRDVTERKRAEDEQRVRDDALRATLVREVNHRIKNNLQAVMGLLRYQASHHPEIGEFIETAITCLGAIATVHGMRALPAVGRPDDIGLPETVTALARSLGGLYPAVPLVVQTDDGLSLVRVMAGESVPMALIINELALNAIKHGGGTAAEPVRIMIERAESGIRVSIVSPNGSLPQPFDFAQGIGLGSGLRLVKMLLPRTGAEIRIENGPDKGSVAALTLMPPLIIEEGAPDGAHPETTDG